MMGGGTGSFACLLLAVWPRFLTGDSCSIASAVVLLVQYSSDEMMQLINFD